MKITILLIGLLLSLLLETTIVSLPLVLLWLLIMVVMIREEWIFFIAIFAGFILDCLQLTPFGGHSLFFSLFCLLIFLYEQKFELKSISFIFAMSFFGTILYLLFFGSSRFIFQVISNSFLGVLLFLILSRMPHKKMQDVQMDLIK